VNGPEEHEAALAIRVGSPNDPQLSAAGGLVPFKLLGIRVEALTECGCRNGARAPWRIAGAVVCGAPARRDDATMSFASERGCSVPSGLRGTRLWGQQRSRLLLPPLPGMSCPHSCVLARIAFALGRSTSFSLNRFWIDHCNSSARVSAGSSMLPSR